ncbi:hypothetical protein COBT_003410, partial [Conglomerata obtusa]
RLTEHINLHLKLTSNINEAKGIIILGGDGTILKTLLTCQKADMPPIYTINYGSFGALSLCEPDELNAIIYQLQMEKPKFNILNRKRLFLENNGFFLNDVILTNKFPGKLNKYIITVDDVEYGSVLGDSVIIATITGSSGYNMSVGGCYVENGCEAIILTVVSPFRSFIKNIMFSINKRIKVSIEKNGLCIVDGCEENEQNNIEVFFKDN